MQTTEPEALRAARAGVALCASLDASQRAQCAPGRLEAWADDHRRVAAASPDDAAAARCLAEAADLLRLAGAPAGDTLAYKLGVVELARAERLHAVGDIAEAQAAYATAAEAWLALEQRGSALFTPELIDLLANTRFARAQLLLALTEPVSAARLAALAATDWARAAVASGAEPSPARLDALANAHAFQGVALRMAGDGAGALQSLEQAETLWDALERQLGDATPDGLRQRLALARAQLAELDPSRA